MYPFTRIAMHLFASVAFLCLLVHPAMAQNVKKKLTVTLNPTSVNTGGGVMGTVAHNASTSTSVTVALTSSPTASVTIPATVTIPAGNASATFAITAGATPQTVTITAAAGGFQSGSANLTITAPSLPNIAYGIDLVTMPAPAFVYGVNNRLQVVGYMGTQPDVDSTAFLYDYGSGKLSTLADLISAADMQSLLDPDIGFTVSKFRGINDSGVIVGYVGTPHFTAADGIIVDTRTTPATLTRISELPEFQAEAFFNPYLVHINNWGDLVGGYHVGTDYLYSFVARYDAPTAPYVITDFGSSLFAFNASDISDSRLAMLRTDSPNSTAWRYDLISGSLGPLHAGFDIDRLSLHSMDESGFYAGSVATKAGSRFDYNAVAYNSITGSIIWKSTQKSSGLVQINDRSDADNTAGVTMGDIAFIGGRYGDQLFLRNPKWGEIDIDKLIHPSDPNRNAWLNGTPLLAQMTQKQSETNFGAIVGSFNINDPVPTLFLLIPVPHAR